MRWPGRFWLARQIAREVKETFQEESRKQKKPQWESGMPKPETTASSSRESRQKAAGKITHPREIFSGMLAAFNPQAAQDLRAVYQFDLTGDKGGQWYVIIENKTCTVGEGRHASPDLTITMVGQDYLDMINGKLDPQMAFMSGKLKIAGDMSLAIKMAELFPAPGP